MGIRLGNLTFRELAEKVRTQTDWRLCNKWARKRIIEKHINNDKI